MQDYYVDSELYCKFDGQKIKMIKFARQNKQKCKREHKNILTTLSVTILKMDETEKKNKITVLCVKVCIRENTNHNVTIDSIMLFFFIIIIKY